MPFMWETKRKMRQEIGSLRNEVLNLRRAEKQSAFIKKAGLPQCESVVCRGCKWAVLTDHTVNGAHILLGCAKDLKCKDFYPIRTIRLIHMSDKPY